MLARRSSRPGGVAGDAPAAPFHARAFEPAPSLAQQVRVERVRRFLEAQAACFQVPVGTYLVRTFYFPNDARDASRGIHLVETRFLVRQAGGYEVST